MTRVATGDVQVPEVLARLDVCFRQPRLQLGDNDLSAVRLFAVRCFVLLETGTDVLQSCLDDFTERLERGKLTFYR